jgi:transmembrane sensor
MDGQKRCIEESLASMAADETKADDIPDDLFEEAVRWFMRLRDPDIQPEIRIKFQRWCNRDAANFRAYQQAERLWNALDKPTKHATGENAEAIAELIAKARRRKPGRSLRRTTLGLAFVAVAIATYWWQGDSLDDLVVTHVTASGLQQHYVLDDKIAIRSQVR